MASFLSKILGGSKPEPQLDYEKLIHLDAEDLAEQGIAEAYARVCEGLTQFIELPAEIRELVDNDAPSYIVQCAGTEHVVYSPAIPGSDEQSWGRAAYILFSIVNEQLQNAPVRLYALYGGNDLSGILLSPEIARSAQEGISKPSERPYLPTMEHPYYGQFR